MIKPSPSLLVSTVLATGLTPIGALAAPGLGTVTFNGTVTTTCSVNVLNGGLGTLAPNGALTSLSSKQPGGSPAVVEVTTTGGVRVSLDAVSGVSAPATDVTPTTWVPTYTMSGAQSVAETGTPTLMTGSGTRTMNVHLAGTKAAAETFTGGTYSATVSVRCE